MSVPHTEEQLKRKKLRDRGYYLAKLQKKGKVEKKDDIRNRRMEIVRMIQCGLNQKQICSELHISRSTYFYDLKIIKEDYENL